MAIDARLAHHPDTMIPGNHIPDELETAASSLVGKGLELGVAGFNAAHDAYNALADSRSTMPYRHLKAYAGSQSLRRLIVAGPFTEPITEAETEPDGALEALSSDLTARETRRKQRTDAVRVVRQLDAAGAFRSDGVVAVQTVRTFDGIDPADTEAEIAAVGESRAAFHKALSDEAKGKLAVRSPYTPNDSIMPWGDSNNWMRPGLPSSIGMRLDRELTWDYGLEDPSKPFTVVLFAADRIAEEHFGVDVAYLARGAAISLDAIDRDGTAHWKPLTAGLQQDPTNDIRLLPSQRFRTPQSVYAGVS